jgi:2-methylcitrate dehydratase
MGMHFKLGLYEHQSAGALQGVLDLLKLDAASILGDRTHESIEKIQITAYESAFSIIGDLAKRNPKTRQSADHSMVYIVASLLRKALNKYDKVIEIQNSSDDLWKTLMLKPMDYGY